MDLGRKRRNVLVLPKTAESDASDAAPSPATTIPSSPASSDGDRRVFSFSSIKNRTWRSLSSRDVASEGSSSMRSPSTHGRKLSKTRTSSSVSTFEILNRRSSGFSDDRGRMSFTADTASTTSSSIVDWRTQNVEGFAPLESDTQLLKTKTPYLVVTADYLVKLKCRADVLALFPRLSDKPSPESSTSSTPEPLMVIPMASVVSVFVAESTRPSFGIEVWWRSMSGVSFYHAAFFFSLPTERDEQMHHIRRSMRPSQHDGSDVPRWSQHVISLMKPIHEAEEPNFKHRKLDVFAVVPRGNTRKECCPKSEDSTKKLHEGPSFYLVVGPHLCYFVEVHRGKGGDPVSQHKTFGMVTLETFRGDWIRHQERFNITFRDPFKAPVTLELASRYYRQIIRVFGKTDRFLRPAWPQVWQTLEVFRIAGLKEPEFHLPTGEDFGSVKRTLDAYLAAYRCHPVEWEINWKTQFAPEFRLLPPKRGSPYSALQLLAVLRGLRYNDYFNSLSFRNIDLAVLWNVHDTSAKKSNIAYLSRTCVALGEDDIELLKISPLLHQEFHALAYCSENLRQIDFTNSSASVMSRWKHVRNTPHTLQFLTPILHLLRSGITRCNRLILSGNVLLRPDIEDIAETLDKGSIQALDVSRCGLDDMSLRDSTIAPLFDRPRFLQVLNLSGNPGRIAARFVPGIVERFLELRQLNLCGAIQGDIDGPLLPCDALNRLRFLEELDIANFKVNDATLLDLEQFLLQRGWRMDEGQPSSLRRLALDNCGITGIQAARLFNALGQNHGIHLSLNSNPLEEGIEYLAHSIRENHGPAGLSMEMVEFRDEHKYLLLIKALTETWYLSTLSLAGTTATSTAHEACSKEMISTLENFLAHNRSIRSLDYSGFCGRLDDCQLAKGFGRSLIGLTKNKTMTHLRIRNQNLHDDAGTLGTVLRENERLVMFDCQDNNLNLTSLQFLVSSLKDNTHIIEFPFSKVERDTIWQNILNGLHRQPQPPTTKSGGSNGGKNPLRQQELMLWNMFCGKFEELDGYLQRNRTARELTSGEVLNFENTSNDSRGVADGRGWPTLELKAWPREDTGNGKGPGMDKMMDGAADSTTLGRATVHSSAMVIDTSASASYRVRQPEDGMVSPVDTLDPVSEISTPPELASPATSEDMAFRKILVDFGHAGFDDNNPERPLLGGDRQSPSRCGSMVA